MKLSDVMGKKKVPESMDDMEDEDLEDEDGGDEPVSKEERTAMKLFEEAVEMDEKVRAFRMLMKAC